jgi:hypothetical protein
MSAPACVATLCLAFLLAGCRRLEVVDLDGGDTGAGGVGAGGSGGGANDTSSGMPSSSSSPSASSSEASTTGGMVSCEPGATLSCFDGPTGSAGVGICVAGLATCNATGDGFGPCVGEVLPEPVDDCLTPEDEDCDGVSNTDCDSVFPIAPTAADFGWQGVQDRFAHGSTLCTGEVAAAISDQALCFAGSDNRLHCAGQVGSRVFGASFVDAGLEDPRQILITATFNVPEGNAMCVVVGDGSMQCLGHRNAHGELGTGDTNPVDAFTAWGGRHDIVRGATGSGDQFCVVTVDHAVYCAGYAFTPVPSYQGRASAMWNYGALHLDEPGVFRVSPGLANCRVQSVGLLCDWPSPQGPPGHTVTGGQVLTPYDGEGTACHLDDDANVACFSVATSVETPLFAQGKVIELLTNYYSEAICAVYADGSLWCIGPNQNGKLGVGSVTELSVETEVAPPGSVRPPCSP